MLFDKVGLISFVKYGTNTGDTIKALNLAIDQEIQIIEQYIDNIWTSTIKCRCFSERKSDLTIWYHYANKYSGVCNEHDMEKFK